MQLTFLAASDGTRMAKSFVRSSGSIVITPYPLVKRFWSFTRNATNIGQLYALLVTLRDGRPPFRWATYHVPEGRMEAEDLRVVTLEHTVARVLDGIGQAVRLATHPDDTGLLIRGGAWCRSCLREPDCPEAAAARARYEAGMHDRGT